MLNKNVKLTYLALFLIALIGQAQENLILSFSDFMSWTPSSPLTIPENVSTVPLQERFSDPSNHTILGLSSDPKILYCPDWINNFTPEVGEFEPFNKYFVTQWQYIDILVWFHGGKVVIPKGSWIDAAHKNGVKVIGTIMFYPNTPGMNELLAQDSEDNYLAVPIMIELAEYYGFDGWFFNVEQSSTSANATKFLELLAQFKEESNDDFELIWYDSMTEYGYVSYQNALTSANDLFFENSNGIFTNYWWNSNHINNSVNHAQNMGLSEFNIYTGADMWPGRTQQTAFTNTHWVDWVCTSGTNNLRTSLALFAMNFTYQWEGFTNFQNDSLEYLSSYHAERNIFSGDNLNPFEVEENTFKGLSNYISPKTVILNLPFSTSFNTGHGLEYWNEGLLSPVSNWYDMSQQEILPTWTFYKNMSTQFDIEYDFLDAFNGGTSLKLKGEDGSLLENEEFKLFKTSITNPELIDLKLTSKFSSNDDLVESSVICYFSSGNTEEFVIQNDFSGNWFTSEFQFNISSLDTLKSIGIKINENTGTQQIPFELNIGKIELLASNSIENIDNKVSYLDQNYPNPFNPITKINYELPNINYINAEIIVYNSLGQSVWSSGHLPFTILQSSIIFEGSKFNSGIYYYSLIVDGNKLSTKSMLLIK